MGVARLIANHPILSVFESIPEVRVLPSPGVTRLHRYYDPVRLPSQPPPEVGVEVATLAAMGLPRFTDHLPDVLCPLPRRIERVQMSITSPSTRPSPSYRRVGIRDFTFEACSGFTRVTARRVARPPKAAFVRRLRSSQSPSQTARQLSDLSTTV
jgi:hypothetical protein